MACPDTEFLVIAFLSSILWICHPILPLPEKLQLKDISVILWKVPCVLLSSLVALFFFAFDFWQFNYNVPWCGPTPIQLIWSPLDLLGLEVHFSTQVQEVFNHYCFKYTFFPFLFLLSFWSPHNENFSFSSCFIISVDFLPTVSLFLFYYSDSIISTVFSSRSLILSLAWLSQLLEHSIEFFSSIILFFNSGFFFSFLMVDTSLMSLFCSCIVFLTSFNFCVSFLSL